jgi:hypothetical protein
MSSGKNFEHSRSMAEPNHNPTQLLPGVTRKLLLRFLEWRSKIPLALFSVLKGFFAWGFLIS